MHKQSLLRLAQLLNGMPQGVTVGQPPAESTAVEIATVNVCFQFNKSFFRN